MFVILFALISFIFEFSEQSAIPSYIKICHQSDPKIAECLLTSVNNLRPKLKTGIPELNVPTLDPLPLNEVKLRSGPNQAQINADFTDINLYGLVGADIRSIRSDFTKKIIFLNIKFPDLFLHSKYQMDVNVLLLKYEGHGIMSGNLTDYGIDASLEYKTVKKDGIDKIHFSSLIIKIIPGKSVFKFDDDDKSVIAQGVAQVIAENIDLIIQEILPVLEKSIQDKLLEIATNIANSFPANEIFPE